MTKQMTPKPLLTARQRREIELRDPTAVPAHPARKPENQATSHYVWSEEDGMWILRFSPGGWAMFERQPGHERAQRMWSGRQMTWATQADDVA